MEPQVDEVNTFEIEIEDLEFEKNFASANEGEVDREQMRQAFQSAKSPQNQKKVVFKELPEEEKKEETKQAKGPKSEQLQRNERRKERRFRRFIKSLPMTRQRLSKLKNVRILNQYKESSGAQ